MFTHRDGAGDVFYEITQLHVTAQDIQLQYINLALLIIEQSPIGVGKLEGSSGLNLTWAFHFLYDAYLI